MIASSRSRSGFEETGDGVEIMREVCGCMVPERGVDMTVEVQRGEMPLARRPRFETSRRALKHAPWTLEELGMQ